MIPTENQEKKKPLKNEIDFVNIFMMLKEMENEIILLKLHENFETFESK